MPRPHPQGGHGRVRGDGHRRLRHFAVREGLHRLPQRPRPGTAFADRPRPGASGARLYRGRQGRAQRPRQADCRHRRGQRLQLGVCRVRFHGRGRDHGRRPGTGGTYFYRPVFENGSRRRPEGRGQAHRAVRRGQRHPPVSGSRRSAAAAARASVSSAPASRRVPPNWCGKFSTR